jgi:hypothetical protein
MKRAGRMKKAYDLERMRRRRQRWRRVRAKGEGKEEERDARALLRRRDGLVGGDALLVDLLVDLYIRGMVIWAGKSELLDAGSERKGKWDERTHNTVKVTDQHGLEQLPGLLRVSDILKGLGGILACDRGR